MEFKRPERLFANSTGGRADNGRAKRIAQFAQRYDNDLYFFLRRKGSANEEKRRQRVVDTARFERQAVMVLLLLLLEPTQAKALLFPCRFCVLYIPTLAVHSTLYAPFPNFSPHTMVGGITKGPTYSPSYSYLSCRPVIFLFFSFSLYSSTLALTAGWLRPRRHCGRHSERIFECATSRLSDLSLTEFVGTSCSLILVGGLYCKGTIPTYIWSSLISLSCAFPFRRH